MSLETTLKALKALDDLSNVGSSENQKVYVGLHAIDILKQLKEIQEVFEELLFELSKEHSEEDLRNKIQEKQESLENNHQFMKTFSPIMLLYNLGFIRRTWD